MVRHETQGLGKLMQRGGKSPGKLVQTLANGYGHEPWISASVRARPALSMKQFGTLGLSTTSDNSEPIVTAV